MNDDDIERRLRRALRAKAEHAVDGSTVAARRTAPAPRWHARAVPMIAGAALVSTVAIGSVALVAVTGHRGHPHQVDSQSLHVTTDRTPLTLSVPTTAAAGSDRPTRPQIASPGVSGPTQPSAPWPLPDRRSPSATTTHDGAAPSTPRRSSSTRPEPSSAPTTAPSPPTTRPTTTRPTTTRPTTTRPTTTRPSTTQSVPSVPVCPAAALSLSIGGDRLVGTGGGDYTFLDLTNSGPSCALTGYPGIAIFDGSGTRIGGPAAHRASPRPVRIVLTHGGRAEVELYDLNTSAPDCTATYGVGRTLRFTPPGLSTPITINYGYSACQLSMTSLHPPKAHPVTD